MPVLDTKAFRQMIAARCCSSDGESPECLEDYREAVRLLAIVLASNFGEDLDRKTLWKRISSAVSSACAKVPSGEPDLLLSAMLEHVKADEASTSRDVNFVDLLASWEARSDTWREGLVTYLRQNLFAALVFMRQAWSAHKAPYAGPKGGTK